MTVLRTTAGATLYAELESGNALTTSYGTLILGQGNDVPALTDATADVTERIPIALSTEPERNTRDVRNPGRFSTNGTAVWTWTWEVSPPSEPWVASNLALASNPLVTANPLAIHARRVVAGEPYRTLVVFFNLTSAGATLYTVKELEPTEAARFRSVGPQAAVLWGGPGGTTLEPNRVRSRVRPGESAAFIGRLYGFDSQPIEAGDVRYVRRTIEAYDPDSNSYTGLSVSTQDGCILERASRNVAAQFPYRGGANWDASLKGNFTTDGVDKRVSYEVALCDGNRLLLYHDIEVVAR